MKGKMDCVAGLALSLFLACALEAAAEPVICVWTGAEDGYWTNANNWASGVVPGRYYATDSDGESVPMGEPDSVAEFGPVSEGASTVVDMSGLGSVDAAVSDMHFIAGSPAFTFGTEGTQAQGVCLAAGGRILMDAGAGDVVFQGYWIHRKSGSYTIENNSSSTLRFKKYGRYSPYFYNPAAFGQTFKMYLCGSGPVVIDGMADAARSGGAVELHLLATTGQTEDTNLAINCNMLEWFSGIMAETDSRITLGENGVISGYFYYECLQVHEQKTLTIDGDGVFKDSGQMSNGMRKASPVRINNKGTLRIKCRTESILLSGEQTVFNWYYGLRATLEFGDGNTRAGDIAVVSTTGDATLKVGLFGDGEGNPGELGYGNVRIGGWNRILYAGPGETTVRTLCITNHSIGYTENNGISLAPAFVLEQGGTGDLVFNGRISADGVTGNAVVELVNNTEFNATIGSPLTDGAGSVLNLVKTGSGRWTLNGANTMTGAITNSAGTLTIGPGCGFPSGARIVMAGGMLEFAGAGARTMPVLELVSDSVISLSDACEVDFSGLVNADGVGLDIICPSGVSLAFPGLTPDSCAPDWLKVNGCRAYVNGEGRVVEDTTSWNASQDGSWGTAANWSAGVPSVDKVTRIERNGDYTVSVDEDAVDAGSFLMGGGTLSVSASLGFRAKLFELSRGADIVVEPSGELVVNSNATTVLEHPVIRTDSRLRVAGGTARFGVGNPDPGFLPGSDDYGVFLDGGEIEVAGAGILDVLNTHGVCGTGTVRFSGDPDSAFLYGGHGAGPIVVAFSTGEASGTLNVLRTGGTKFIRGNSNGAMLCVGYSQSGKTCFTMEGTDDNDRLGSSDIYYLGVGVIRGEGELLINGGAVRGGNMGIHVGTGYEVPGVSCVTGTVRMTDGLLRSESFSHIYLGSVDGLIFGYGAKAEEGSCVCGNLILEGGRVESYSAPAFFGLGRAVGKGLQTGGVVRMSGYGKLGDVVYPDQSHVFGYGGGTGEYVISNGTFTTSNGAMYIGGCLPGDIKSGKGVSGGGGKNSNGAFYARGGKVEVAYPAGVIVGADGRGRLEIGPSGDFRTPRLAVSNQVEGVLAFELGTAGAGTLVVTNLEISAGAKLVVDATGLPGAMTRRVIRLATLQNPPVGAFTEDDITFLHTPAQEAYFTGARIVDSLNGRPGLWLTAAPVGMSIVIR